MALALHQTLCELRAHRNKPAAPAATRDATRDAPAVAPAVAPFEVAPVEHEIVHSVTTLSSDTLAALGVTPLSRR